MDVSFLKSYFEECKEEECKDTGVKLPIPKKSSESEDVKVESIFKLDSEKCKKKYFGDPHQENLKVSDCAIVIRYRSQFYCLIVELKSGRADKNACEQINNTCKRLVELQEEYNEERDNIKTKANLRTIIYVKGRVTQTLRKVINQTNIRVIKHGDLEKKDFEAAISHLIGIRRRQN